MTRMDMIYDMCPLISRWINAITRYDGGGGASGARSGSKGWGLPRRPKRKVMPWHEQDEEDEVGQTVAAASPRSGGRSRRRASRAGAATTRCFVTAVGITISSESGLVLVTTVARVSRFALRAQGQRDWSAGVVAFSARLAPPPAGPPARKRKLQPARAPSSSSSGADSRPGYLGGSGPSNLRQGVGHWDEGR